MRFLLLCLALMLVSCPGKDDPAAGPFTDTAPPPGDFATVLTGLAGGLLNVWGTSTSDVWVVGADAGSGPEVRHYDGQAWTTKSTGTRGDLWWTYGFAGGPTFMGGADGTILKYSEGFFEKQDTPGVSGIVFGIWGAAPNDVWAVGGIPTGGDAFAWRYDGVAWRAAEGLPDDVANGTLFKVWGCSANDVWIVGAAPPNVRSTSEGLCVHWDGAAFARADCGTPQRLLTVHSACASSSPVYVAVGGSATAALTERVERTWKSNPILDTAQLMGVCMTATGGWTTSFYGDFYYRTAKGWEPIEVTVPSSQALHACWVDPDGGVWAAGGDIAAVPLVNGVLIYRGAKPPLGGLGP